MRHNWILLTGALLGATGVMLGAFGAHWLEDAVTRWDLTPQEQARQLEIWETAVRYHFFHALALLAVGLLERFDPQRAWRCAAVAFVLGVAIFSGCLYALVLSGVKLLGAVVVLGGVSFIVGWLILAAGCCGCCTQKNLQSP